MKFKIGDKVQLNNTAKCLGEVKRTERMKHFTKVVVMEIDGELREYREDELSHFKETKNVNPTKGTEKERAILVDMIYDMFVHACHTENITEDKLSIFNHNFISTYESVQFFLLHEGKITKDQCYYK